MLQAILGSLFQMQSVSPGGILRLGNELCDDNVPSISELESNIRQLLFLEVF
jgi:hypothetical protein